MKTIQNFILLPFIQAVEEFYKGLNIPVNILSTLPTNAAAILDNDSFNHLIEEVYPYGIINDAIFEKENTFNNIEEVKTLKSDYEGILLFGITLIPRENDLLPTRGQLAEITRAVNKAFPFTPVNIIFKYDKYIALASTERMQYKQAWREGEKMGKVSLLRDIDCEMVHSGHIRILQNLEITRSGKNAINNFDSLYKYWQDVLSVSILNKVFYRELQNWYFWAIKEVRFPDEPLQLDFDSLEKYDEALKEHKGKNVIRLLTRLLFIWFIKEKGLIPDEIFDEKEIAKHFIDGFTPQKPEGMFADGKYSSKYYRAILQNLFFATLNQPRNEREFRADGKHQNATQLMRYKSYLKKPGYFIELMESKVPFMNGGLFECLDKPHPTLKGPQGGDRIMYVDGFSDRPDNELVVPDFLFFDADEEIDLSAEYGNAKAKKEKTRGLFTILKSYKFTITENTPIDEEVALDPELLGKVFENLLASYNPETKTTARKQTGSFYTPREIVNYMVEESLIAYLKNELLHEEAGVQELGKKQIALFGNETKAAQLTFETKIDESPFKGKEDQLDTLLHQLVSYSNTNPFIDDPEVKKKIIKALDNCKILDPACGSGAYPMGILQKMVHILHKIDPNNTEWKQRQIDRVNDAIESLEQVEDAEIKNKSIKDLKAQIQDIEASFENNELDYGRKLYLIENCIYGVDIQPIATQISKLRFFISLVVDQKVDAVKDNFGVRPLPNLETKFVAANTLIGLPKQKVQGSLFDKREVKKLEDELKKVRHKLFSVKKPSRKRELRVKDKELREQMSEALAEQFGNETAQLLAKWDPYDQNTSSPFFDTEWMFDITKGFDIVIGNPPYVEFKNLDKESKKLFENSFISATGKYDIYILFYEKGMSLLNSKGTLCYITPTRFLIRDYGKSLRNIINDKYSISKIIDFGDIQIFESATTYTGVFLFSKNRNDKYQFEYLKQDENNTFLNPKFSLLKNEILKNEIWNFTTNSYNALLNKLRLNSYSLENITDNIAQGIASGKDEVFFISEAKIKEYNIEKDIVRPVLKGKDISKYNINWSKKYVVYMYDSEGKVYDENKMKSDFPNCYKYLLENKNKLSGRGYFEKSNKNWYELWNQRRPTNFNKEKIITLDNSSGNNFAFDTNNFYGTTTVYGFSSKTEEIENKYLIATLNSKLLEFYHKLNSVPQANGFYRYQAIFINSMPIKKIQKKLQKPFIDLVNDILLYKNQKKDSSLLEKEIDLMVYKLYGLTYDEVLLVEPEFSEHMSKEEYENLKVE